MRFDDLDELRHNLRERNDIFRFGLVNILFSELRTGLHHAPSGDSPGGRGARLTVEAVLDRKSTRLNSSHRTISYAVFCLKKKKQTEKRCIAYIAEQPREAA